MLNKRVNAHKINTYCQTTFDYNIDSFKILLKIHREKKWGGVLAIPDLLLKQDVGTVAIIERFTLRNLECGKKFVFWSR